MGREDWTTVKIPALMIQDIDNFLKTPISKKNGINSRDAFVTAVLRSWFSKFEKDYGLFSTRETVSGGDVTKPFEEQ